MRTGMFLLWSPHDPTLTDHFYLQNYKVYCTLNNIPIDESLASAADLAAVPDAMDVEMDDDAEDNDDDEENNDVEAMEEDDEEEEDMPVFFKEQNDANAKDAKTPSKNPKSKVALIVKAKLNKVLASTGLADKRARMCDQNDFLKLLLGRLLFFYRFQLLFFDEPR